MSREREANWADMSVFLALVRHEPDWREVTIDHGDARLGGFVLGGEPERLHCVNRYAAEEVDLPAPELHVFFVAEEPPLPMKRLGWLRRHRASTAAERIEGARRREEGRQLEAVRWDEELSRAREARDEDHDVAAAATLLESVLQSLPGPWALTRVARNEATGGLWTFAVDAAGDLVLGSHDVEARRAGEPPALLWVPAAGREALRGLLDHAQQVGAAG